jgi:hypothetical protein
MSTFARCTIWYIEQKAELKNRFWVKSFFAVLRALLAGRHKSIVEFIDEE